MQQEQTRVQNTNEVHIITLRNIVNYSKLQRLISYFIVE